jgi:site-specific DNA recombinase
LGEAVHKGTPCPGEHQAIIDRATWDKVHTILATNTVMRGNHSPAQTPALLEGLIFAPGGYAMTPSHTRKGGKLYRYYIAIDAIHQGYSECAVRAVSAVILEGRQAKEMHLEELLGAMPAEWEGQRHFCFRR